jgi:hypothetical protein
MERWEDKYEREVERHVIESEFGRITMDLSGFSSDIGYGTAMAHFDDFTFFSCAYGYGKRAVMKKAIIRLLECQNRNRK